MQSSPAQQRHITLLSFLIPFLIGICVDLYVPSLPIIASYFHTSSCKAQLTISAYMLGYGIGQFFLGILSDSIGRKKILLASTACFTVASFLSVIAPNIDGLILCRLLQGLSIGGLGAVFRAVITDYFPEAALIKAVSILTMSWALGPIVGPFIGGYLQHYFNWQADFYFFSLYGLLVFLYMFIVLPETNHNLHSLHPTKIYHATKTVLTNPLFLIYAIVSTLAYAILVLFNTIGPFLIQEVLKYPVVIYGYIALLLGLLYFLGGFCNRIMLNYFRPTQMTLVMVIATLATSIIFVALGLFIKLSLWIILIPLSLLFFFDGFIIPNMAAKISGMLRHTAGTVSAMYGLIVATGVFFITTFATTLKINSQMPLAIMYVVMLVASLILFVISQRLQIKSAEADIQSTNNTGEKI